jgi:hypothetical protein
MSGAPNPFYSSDAGLGLRTLIQTRHGPPAGRRHRLFSTRSPRRRAGTHGRTRPRGGRPRIPDEIRQLIRKMSVAKTSAIFATFSHRTERTYRCRRTRRFGVMCAEQGVCVRRRSWAGYSINMFEFEFPTGTAAKIETPTRRMTMPPFHLAQWHQSRRLIGIRSLRC